MDGALDENLATDHGIDGYVQQESGQHGGYRRRTFRVRVGKPVVQRCEPCFRAVADEQKDEGETQDGRLQLPLHAIQVRPQQRAHSFGTEGFLGGKIQEDGAEECLRDADAAKDEILPAGFEARCGSVERYEQHRRECGGFHRDP